jgi:hypothetical protein
VGRGRARALALVAVAACGSGPLSGFPSPAPGADASATKPDSGAGTRGADAGSDAAGHLCVNLQCNQVDCASQGLPSTTISGVVYDPAGQNPLYNVIVYVPNKPLEPLAAGVTCDHCGVVASGEPLVAALTDARGKFQLVNVPAGDNVPLVLQLGKWRKQVVVPHVEACTDTAMANRSDMRLPARKSEGDMPQIAITTGGCDPFECLLRKIGIDGAEFTSETGSGRVHVYQGAGGATLAQSLGPTTPAATLWSSSSLASYDLLLHACECGEQPQEKPQAAIDNVVAYANAGGRVFNTHYHYYWIDPTKLAPPSTATGATNPSWQTTATFVPEATGASSLVGFIDTTFPKGDAFAQWLYEVGASTAEGQLPIAQARYNATSANPPSTQWVWNPNTGQTQTPWPALLHYTFNTPVGVPDARQCGKVLFSDFHVVSPTLSSGTVFPEECDGAPMSPQEKALEFMLFDLSSCIEPETMPPLPPAPLQ